MRLSAHFPDHSDLRRPAQSPILPGSSRNPQYSFQLLFAFENGVNGDILVQKAPACTIKTQAEAVCEIFGGDKNNIKVIGIRHGEKMYETLLTNEECAKAEDMGDFYRVPADQRSLNYDKYFSEGDAQRNTLTEFNSNNTELLNTEQVKEKLLALSYIQEELAKMEK